MAEQQQKKRFFKLKEQYRSSPEEELDVGLLPSLILSTEMLNDAQELIRDPTNLRLIERIQKASFANPSKAYKILARATMETLNARTGINITEEEMFEDVENPSAELFEEVDEPLDVSVSSPSTTGMEINESSPPRDTLTEYANLFVDDTSSQPTQHIQDIPPVTFQVQPGPSTATPVTTSHLESYHRSMLDALGTISSQLAQMCALQSEKLDVIANNLCSLRSDVVDLTKKIENMEEIQATQKNHMADLCRRLGMSAPKFYTQPSVPTKQHEERTLKTTINEANLNSMIVNR